MGAHLEYDEVGLLDAARQRLDEAGRGDDIVLPEGDLRRRRDLAEWRCVPLQRISIYFEQLPGVFADLNLPCNKTASTSVC